MHFKNRTMVNGLILNFTGPNNRGGPYLDWIVTNSDFVSISGRYDAFMSDHVPVYCICKKTCEHHA